MTLISRRRFTAGAAATAIMTRHMAFSGDILAQTSKPANIPMRQLTHGPAFHWFGYYDKLEFDPTSRYVLGNQVHAETLVASPDETIRLGVIDTEDGDRWTDIGESQAWNWQQGCQLQWLPGSNSEVIWNDREGKEFVSHRLDIKTGKKRTLPRAVSTISPDCRWALCLDYARLHETRSVLGYAGVPDPNNGIPAPSNSGIWRMNLETGKTELLFSLADISGIDDGKNHFAGATQWLEQPLYAPNGEKFCFLHRWKSKSDEDFGTRLITATAEGKDFFVLDIYGKTSHFWWRDQNHILAWAWNPLLHRERFYLFEDRTRKLHAVGPDVLRVNGHCSYLPGNDWILSDTYPDKQRLQHPYLYNVCADKKVPLGHFYSAPKYVGDYRCDTHPRFSPDGRKVVIDSPHEGGRQLYLFDVSSVVEDVMPERNT